MRQDCPIIKNKEFVAFYYQEDSYGREINGREKFVREKDVVP